MINIIYDLMSLKIADDCFLEKAVCDIVVVFGNITTLVNGVFMIFSRKCKSSDTWTPGKRLFIGRQA